VVLNFALEDGADHLFLVGLLDFKLLQHAVFKIGYTTFEGLGIDDKFLELLVRILVHRLRDALEEGLLFFPFSGFAGEVFF
jgi:hypothetical protein